MITHHNIEELDRIRKFEENKLKKAYEPSSPIAIFRNPEPEDDTSSQDESETIEFLDNQSIILNGEFRFNDQKFQINPEQISVMVDEYENSLLLMRQETPIAAQSGKKKVRIIVNFPVDIGMGWSQLAKIITQIKKTPIATIENEKIRKELFGELKDTANIGVVVDNLSGYVEEDYPTLIRCTLQMSWFNHAPYVQELLYLEDFGDLVKKQTLYSSKFRDFYLEGTSKRIKMPGSSNEIVIMNNDPSLLPDPESLVILYKEYEQFSDALTLDRIDERSTLSPKIEGADQQAFEFQKQLEAEGWYLAEEDQSKLGNVVEGVFYKWKKFEIPFTDLDSSGALILQNMSFSLNTNPSYINMEKYSIPTVQFLGGSVSDIRAIVFAAGEHSSSQDKTPISTSKRLSELQAIIKRVADDRIRFSKFNKENHLLISHPIAKLLKYRTYPTEGTNYVYINDQKQPEKFDINSFLPVIVSSLNSTTIPGLPFASKLQLDFKETRLAKNTSYIKYSGTTGSTNAVQIIKEIIKKVYSNNGIYLDNDDKFKQSLAISKKYGPEWTKGESLAQALTDLRHFDKTVFDLDTAFDSLLFKANSRLAQGTSDAGENLSISEIKNRIGRGQEVKEIKNVFRPDWLEQFVLALYIDYSKSLYNGEEWVESYIDLFDQYTEFSSKAYKDLYPDMMLPEDEISPSFYFADNDKQNKHFKSNILRNMPDNYKNIEGQISTQLIQTNYTPGSSQNIKPSSIEGFAPAFNYGATSKGKQKGAARVHVHNDSNFRIMATQQAIADASPPTYSLAQVYPTFQVQIMSPQYNLFGELSAEDLSEKELRSESQLDLLDLFDLSSILDIRIIKDEYEAADVMIIRIANTYKTLMTREGKDPTYNHNSYSALDVLSGIIDGKTTASVINTNLEDIGLKEGVRIKAQLGNSNLLDELSVEFQGRIAAVNGKDVIEVYCVGDGHELIQNTTGYKGEEKDREYTFNSETTDLIGELLATTDEIKSFGNTQFEIIGNMGLNLPSFMGGISALDNIYAPKLQPDESWGLFATDAVSATLKTYSTIYGIGGVIGGVAATTAFFGSVGLPILGAMAVGTLATAYRSAERLLSPCKFTVYQQTIWDVLQELTLRHPGYICAIVPFDNRATIYFGEPDGTYFHRGVQTAAEKAMKAATAKSGLFLTSRATQREIFDTNNNILKNNPNVSESSYPFLNTNAKTRQEAFDKLVNGSGSQLELLALAAMQKSFRNYHLITSENDIISNDIEASSMDVANSVQVYHPTDDNEGNPDGTTWFSNYALTDKMKADDDLHSNLVNNKVFTFHNAHNEYKDLELPQRYAMAVLCKELENIYKGKITVLGRKGIKPHDIVILSDTHNKISGPVKVGRVVQQVSPETGWVTHIYPKFIAIPNSSAGAFQMKAVLKASRFWLGAHTDLFYSNMQKFIPDEVNDSGKQIREAIKAYEMGFNSPNYQTEEEMTKELSTRIGEHATMSKFGTVGSAAVDGAVFAAGQIGGSHLRGLSANLKDAKGNPLALKDYYLNQGKALAGEGNKIKTTAKAALQAKKIGGAVDTTVQLGKSAFTATKIAGKTLFSSAIGFGGGFLIEYLLESAIDGIISFLKYREPISIFPLTKDGKPWMAALNGYKENSPLEHLEEQSVRAADKLGMTSYLIQKWYREWTGDAPPQAGYGGTFEVDGAPTDGDTLKIKNGSNSETIRILGYDTGELKSYGGTTQGGHYEKMMGQKAKDELTRLIKDNNNQIEIIRHGNDNYNRTLAKIKVKGIDVSEYMRNNYLAMNYPKGMPKDYSKGLPPDKKNDPKAIAEAREQAWKTLYLKHEQQKKLKGIK